MHITCYGESLSSVPLIGLKVSSACGHARHAQVAFASGQFWALVIVDFVMLVMRDVRITILKRLHRPYAT